MIKRLKLPYILMIKTPKKDLFAIKLNDQFLNSRFTITLIIQLT